MEWDLALSCWFSDGSPASDFSPCDPLASTSACCGPGTVCAENFFCKTPNGDLALAARTDMMWEMGDNPSCPCPYPISMVNSTYDFEETVTYCAEYSFCCGPGQNVSECCPEGDGLLPITTFSSTAIMPSHDCNALNSYYAQGTSSNTASFLCSSTSGATSSNKTAPPATTASTRPAPGKSLLAPVTTTTSVQQTPPASGLTSDRSAHQDRTEVGVGVGLGVPLGLLLAVALAFCFRRWQRRQYRAREENAKQWQRNSNVNMAGASDAGPPEYSERESGYIKPELEGDGVPHTTRLSARDRRDSSGLAELA